MKGFYSWNAVIIFVFLVVNNHTTAWHINHFHGKDSNCNILIIKSIVSNLCWDRIHVVHSQSDEIFVTQLLRTFDDGIATPLQTSLWDVTSINRNRWPKLLSTMYGNGYSSVKIILFLNTETLRFLKLANTFDDFSNKTTNYATNSQWLVVDLHNLTIISKKHSPRLRDMSYVSSCSAYYVGDNDQLSKLSCVKRMCDSIHCDYSNQCVINDIFPKVKFKLNGRHLKIGSIKDDTFKSIILKLSQSLAQSLNFTYTYHKPADLRYGYEINGSWTGMIGQLQRREVDLVVDELTVTKDRMKVVDFIRPTFLSQEFGILYRRGVELESTWYRIFKPLRTDVYWCILAALCFVGGLLYLLENSVDSNVGFRFIRYFYIMVDLVGFISVRGGGLWPRSESARVLVAVFWMFCVVVTGVYIGNLTAKITGTREKKPFDSLEELIQTDWKWGINKDGLPMQMIRSSKVKSIQELWNGIVKFNITDPRVLDLNFNNHIEYVLDTTWKYAFIVLDPQFYILNTNDCLIATTDAHIISNLHIALAVPKQSYLKPELERVMSKLLDNGFISIIHDMRYKDNRPWTCKNTLRIRTTNLEDVQGLLLIVCVGLGIALTVLILEILSKLSQRG